MALDFKKYDSRGAFKLANACWLWFGLPPRDMVDDNSPQRVQNILQELKWRIRSRHPEWFPDIPGQTLPKVKQWFYRDEYKAIAKEMLADGAIDRLPAFLFPEERGEPVASREKNATTIAMEKLVLLIREKLAPDRLTVSTARGWLKTRADSSGEVDMDDDSLINIGFDKIVYLPGREKEKIDYTLIGDETRHHMAMRTFEGYIQKVNKEAKKK